VLVGPLSIVAAVFTIRLGRQYDALPRRIAADMNPARLSSIAR
jgi:hypothetical protein